jgi:multidrug efflux pump subunit AcrA (membrane-fusion protein)
MIRIRCLVAICLVLLAGCARSEKQSQPPPPSVKVVAAAQRTVLPMISLSGLIAPLQNVALSSNLQEPAYTVYVNEGDQVRRGQILVRLNTADLDASLAQAQAHLEQTRYQAGLALHQGNDQVHVAQAALAQAQANLDLERLNLTRDQQLVSQGYISVQAVDAQRTTVNVDERNVAATQAALSQAQANVVANGTPDQGLQQANIAQAAAAVAQLQAQIDRASIVSPIDGVVVNRNINPGEYPGGRQIFTLQEVARVYATLNAYGVQVAGLRPGRAVTLTAPSVPRRSFSGIVNAILSPTTPSSSGFIVKVAVPNGDNALRPGMTISANVRQQSRSGIAIPVSAFLDDTHQTVMIVDGDTAHIAQVGEVAEDSNFAIVTGLAAATKVIANGQSNLSEGQKVAVL